jgi:chemotaxis protein histidine kinase CheA
MENIIEIFREKYIEECKVLIEEVRNFIDSGIIYTSGSSISEKIVRNMHTLKGNSRIFSEPEVAEIAEKIETITGLTHMYELRYRTEVCESILRGFGQIYILLDKSCLKDIRFKTNQMVLLSQFDLLIRAAKANVKISMDGRFTGRLKSTVLV